MSDQTQQHPVAAALAVVVRDGSVLLVRRIHTSDAGLWGFPGGWIDPDETIAQAAVRELFEETSVTAVAVRSFNALDAFDYDADGEVRRQFVMVAVLCRWVAGTPIPGDDATEAAWFPVASLQDLEDVSDDVDTLTYQAFEMLSSV